LNQAAKEVIVKRNKNLQMALFAAIGDRFIAKILKQVASDYDLDFEEMKSRYCGKSSFEMMIPTKQVEVDLEDPDRKAIDSKPASSSSTPVKAKKTKAKAKKAPKEPETKLMALSKMKKPELVAECEERGLDSEGTVAQLKERLKEARSGEEPAKPVKEKKEPAKKKSPKKKATKKKEVTPEPKEAEPLEEEEDEPDSPGGIRARMLRDAREFEDEIEEDEEPEDNLQERLRKILAEAEEEEFQDE
jgi:hypothetical protein